jgi:hypothetical protein
MAVIEIILGERSTTGVQTPIEYAVLSEDFCTTINGEMVREPVAPLRERFAKLKARDNILAEVCGELGLVDRGQGFLVMKEVQRLLDERGALAEIAKGLGLNALAAHALPAQVLAMNTELTAALSSSQAEVKTLTEENAQLRADVEQERGQKLHAMTAADTAISRAAELEAEVKALTLKLSLAELDAGRANARSAGLSAELDSMWKFIKDKLRA